MLIAEITKWRMITYIYSFQVRVEKLGVRLSEIRPNIFLIQAIANPLNKVAEFVRGLSKNHMLASVFTS